jgi:hypothetical protein
LLEFLAHLPRLEVLTGFDGELVAEYKVNGAFDGQNAPAPTSPVKEYIYREGQVLVVSEQGNAEGRKLQWLVHDQLGTPRMVFDTSGRLHDDPATTNEAARLPAVWGRECLQCSGRVTDGSEWVLAE